MSKLYSYVPSSVRCKIFGASVDGYSDSNIFDIERDAVATTFRKAQDGSHTAFLDKFGSYRVKLYVSQASEANTWLHLIFKLYQKIGAEFKIPFQIEDGSSGLRFTALDVFFENEPRTVRQKEISVVEWDFVCHNAAYNIEGHGESNDLAEVVSSIVRLIELSELVGVDLSILQDKISSTLDSSLSKLMERF